jgi:hypothetical protein
MLCEYGPDTLPQASRAAQVLVYVESQDPGPGAAVVEITLKTGSESQLSETDGVSKTTVALHPILLLAAPDRTGGAVSTTRTKLWVNGSDTLPQASRAVHVLAEVISHRPGPACSLVETRFTMGSASQSSEA